MLNARSVESNRHPLVASGPRDVVVAAVRQRIEAGVFRSGDGIPSERVLATDLGVSRDTVRAALEELLDQGWLELGRGNRRRVSQRGRRTALSNCIAVLSAEDSEAFDAAKPWIEDRYVMAQAAAVLERHGYHSMSISMPALRQGGDHLIGTGDLRALLVSANICDRPEVVRVIENMDRSGSPVALYGRAVGHDARSMVYSDHYEGSRRLARWLHQQGRRRIACAWMRTSEMEWMKDRYAGYVAGLREVGEMPLPLIEIPKMQDDDRSHAAFEHQAKIAAGYLADCMRSGPGVDALMALNDPQAICLASACRRLGFRPNTDVWLAGYDASWAYAVEWQFESEGPIVTVDKDNAALGRKLAEIALEMISPQRPQDPSRVGSVPRVVPVVRTAVPAPIGPGIGSGRRG